MQKNKLITTILIASLAFGNGLLLNASADANKADDAVTMPAASPVAPAQPAKAEIQPKSPDGWYVIDETQFIHVLDDLDRQMLAARESFLIVDEEARRQDRL